MADRIANELKALKAGDTNLHAHLQKLLAGLILDRAPLANFEAYSAVHRQNPPQDCVYRVREAYAHLRDYETRHRTLLGKLNSGSQEQPQEPASIGYLPDLSDDARQFEKFGVGFGEEESYRIFKALARFALKKGSRQLRLWGKVLGSQRDYYIAEGLAEGGEEAGELSADTEPRGTGVNKNTFWAINDLSGEWTQLPVVSPTQLRIARLIKHVFTGDLTRSILSNPLFVGKEAHLLKCQLVRITASCSIIPKGSLVLNAENPTEVDVPEEYTFPEIGSLAQKQNWVYQNQSILRNGRLTLLKPEGLEPEEEQKWVKAASAKDPTEPRLKSIAADSQKWALRGYQVQQSFKTLGKAGKVVSKGVVGVKSLVWPGWLTIAQGVRTSSIYVGYGHKFGQNYYPFDPENILQQREDRVEFVVAE